MSTVSGKRLGRLALGLGAVVATAVALAPSAGAETPEAPANQAPHGLVLTHPLSDNSHLRVEESAAPAFAGGAPERTLSFTEQVQQKNQWCWAATGVSIEQFHGARTSQAQFCAAGKGTSAGNCPNQPGTMSEILRGFHGTGFSASSTGGAVSFDTITQQIDDGAPMLVGIYWTQGGGHAEVIYGYDSANKSLNVADPWPTYQRYRTQSYNSFLRNQQFTWGDTVVDIAKG
ncbi:papain-like cysteine protease family protein [Streptoalloteichus hindustanus]|uniref:Papain-like cysteine protease AvrRpt2 n=1 Tax=Streptoalloteichus hindustanus TaxID=2017 RepID=A0A1M5ICJ5_STRHI|nr:papain-like cysteine protease family protein [Streptoalloteichus hindustanus]SHG25620.1 Papain-like cysteine protease AvrRpt2 [Streptoalloteichus hindustanus]